MCAVQQQPKKKNPQSAGYTVISQAYNYVVTCYVVPAQRSAYSSAAQAANWNKRRARRRHKTQPKTCARGWSSGPAAMDKYDRATPVRPSGAQHLLKKMKRHPFNYFFFEFLPDDVREEWIPLDSAFWEEIGPLWLTKCIVPPDLEDRGERCLTTLLARSLWKAAGAAVTLRYLSGCQNGQQPTKRLTNAYKLFQGLPEIQKAEDSPFMTQHARCEKMGEN